MHTNDLMTNVCLDIYKIKISISYLTTNSLGNDVFNTPKAFLKSTFCLLKFYQHRITGDSLKFNRKGHLLVTQVKMS